MKIFLDSAEVSEIKKASVTRLVDGVTTNPSLIMKSGRRFADVVKEITKIVNGPISAEVTALDAATMVRQALPLAKIHRNIVIKVPMTEEGLVACAALRQKKIKVNVTLVFSGNQALLAAKAGATFVSPFIGRLDDIGEDGLQLIYEIRQIYDNYNFTTQVLVASIRSAEHVRQVALAGADIATIPPAIFHQLFQHHLTDKGIAKFLQDWQQAKK